MRYDEHRVAPGVEVWSSTGLTGAQRILPDGCLDLLWDGARLLVAGPDAAARLHHSDRPLPMHGARLHGGRGPAAFGVDADALTGRTVPLADVWGDRRSRALAERVAEDPLTTLAVWAARVEAEPFGDRLRGLLGAGHGVAACADRLGWSARQLQRRTRAAFGYGPQHLARVLRLQRVVALADRRLPWAEVAPAAGYSDQAHLSRDVRALTGLTPTGLLGERVRSRQDAA